MIHRFFLSVAVLVATVSAANAAPQMPSRASENAYAAIERFRAGDLPAVDVAALPAPAQKSAPFVDEHGRLRVAGVRALPKSAPVRDWVAIGEGKVNRLRATSQQAQGLRLRLNVGTIQAPLEIRAQGADGRVEAMRVEPGQGPEVWTPWTSGATQVIELFAAHGAPVPAVQLEAVLHFDESPFAKAAAGSCTIPVACSTEDSTLDAAIAERKNSSARIAFVENGSGFLCSATLLNTERFPAGYLLTANHCISTTAAAASVTAFWFYEGDTCADPTVNPGYVQQAGGTQLVFTNHNADSTLLLGQTPPAGAVYAGWNAARVLDGEPVVSISHPRGDTTRLATGSMSGMLRITDRAQDEYGVTFTRGIIEGGSSGSGLFSMSGTSLQLRGVLTGTTIRNGSGMSCTNLDEQGLYGRLEIFAPQMSQYLRASGPTADDTPNRVQDWASVPAEAVLNGRTANFDRRLDYVGDVDVFRFRLDAEANVTLSTQGSLDTVGTLMDASGKSIEANDDVAIGNLNFGITRTLQPGTYHVMVAPWEPSGTGSYRLVLTATNTGTPPPNPGSGNFTDLWYTVSEAGWGINLNHQGDIIFATLYTYDASGAPLWLFMSNGDKQSDGSYAGSLYRATGPAFNASPWGPFHPTPVGTMRLSFSSGSAGVLVYTYNGVSVTKNITRYQFSNPTVCAWTTGDRVGALNYQDLWFSPSEAGWGVNVVHQGNKLFATLYTYDATGQPLWLSMSDGPLVGVRTYRGTLYKSAGPPFNASPWGSYTLQTVGTMTFAFSDGNNGTLTYSVNGVQVVKSIRRFVFSTPVPLCSSS
jgi:lysyl endopeptidase